MQAFRDTVATHSGTASKWGHIFVNQHAAQAGNKLFSMDISAAFLKGMTFQQIAEITGEKLRSVQFDFPPADAWILQTLPGMEGYDHYTEVLDLVKALWGLKDAPRAFGLRLKQTLLQAGYVQGVMDQQIWRKFIQKSNQDANKHGMDEQAFGCNIASVLTTHIDDLKGSSTESERTLLLNLLKKDYGSDVKCELGTFEHVGIKHEQKEDFSVWTHQDHYVKEISEMNIVT